MSNLALLLRVLGVLANPGSLVLGGWRYLVDFFGVRTPISIYPPALQRAFDRFPWLRDNVAVLLVAAIVAWFQALVGLVSAYTAIIGRPFVRALEEDELNQIPSLAELLNIKTNNIPLLGPDGTLLDPALVAKAYGLHPNFFEALFQANGQIPAPGQLLELLNRQDGGEIRGLKKYTDTYVRDSLRESALKDRYIDDIMELRYNLLGAQDYIRFSVRDVYDPVARANLTLDEDFPAALAPKLRALGYSDQDARDVWAAHWDLPSPTQAYEMLHRGLITEKELEDYLRSADYAPKWRPLLKAISYSPLTRVDVRRAYKLGVVTLEQVKQTYKDLGYDDANATILAEFTRVDADEERKQERELLVGPVKNKALAMYQSRRITEADLRGTLANLRYPTEIVDRFIADIDFVRESDRRDDVAAALKASYVKALRSRDDTIVILKKAGYNDEGVAQVMETWDILRESTELQPHQETARDLTKAEILQAYTDDIYSEEQTRAAVQALGYDEAETNAIVSRVVLAKARKVLADEVAVIQEETIAGGRSFDSASIALDRLGVPATAKRLYLIRWGQARQKRIPDFPVALLEKLAAKQLLTTETARFYMTNQGYDEGQQALLLALWDTNRADKQAALDAKRRGITTNAPTN